MINIGPNIRRLRKLNNMNQVEFSSRIGISQGNLSEIEQGNCNPSFDTLLAIKIQFNCNIDDLIIIENDLFKTDSSSVLSEGELSMVSNYRSLDEFDQKEIDEIIKLKIALNKHKIR
ncbi:helix-turn-helix domain-containing protein [Paenibacillus alginolyticus]|uniref:Helix-turn-helix domain-containing protein n=1 Tax=Paenibacillus alginolyticus TaxID=59839 RepID=A0ABT4GIU9_9BACL|nr:helix-turn-helix transcriptional regulator [Paenibacillus alginolyticus]MCY9696140.1 helix-turn-helix domain-containing protein [Paenibacillus alginolyticus]MEC0143293.1 helix-turn-helix transcriptional regulator [Paenibacillus alginolyticus]